MSAQIKEGCHQYPVNAKVAKKQQEEQKQNVPLFKFVLCLLKLIGKALGSQKSTALKCHGPADSS